MTIKEAIEERHMVRHYIDKPIPPEIKKQLEERIEKINKENNLNFTLVTESAKGVGFLARALFKPVVYNYIIFAGEDNDSLDEKIGYFGSDIMLYAQTLGLNSWWNGGMFSRSETKKFFDKGDIRVNGVLAVGYGQDKGKPHKSKSAKEISSYEGKAPQWFINGVRAVLFAPTAVNKQNFTIKGKDNKVLMKYKSGYLSDVDLGIGKYHFEVGAGKENFKWQ